MLKIIIIKFLKNKVKSLIMETNKTKNSLSSPNSEAVKKQRLKYVEELNEKIK
jgi:hypothetical protein